MSTEHPTKQGKPSRKCFTTFFRAQKQTAQTSIQATNTTVEGKFTAQAALTKADKLGLDVPIIRSVSDLVTGTKDVETLLAALLARPQKEE